MDTDGDGMDDNWEMTYFNTLARDGSGDFDGDGMTDLQEYLAGTDPLNPSSALRLQLIHTNSSLLRFTAIANHSYTIQYNDSLQAGTWQRLIDITATPSTQIIQVQDSTPRSGRFYRLHTPQLP